jgi:hypothetical protein
LEVPAVNFFSWDACHQKLPLLWTAIAGFAWSAPVQAKPRAVVSTPTPDTPPIAPLDAFMVKFMNALNSRQASLISTLYDPAATQVWADQIHQDSTAIQDNYTALFIGQPAGSIFTISRVQVKDNQRLYSWKFGELSGETSLLLKSGKIILEHTFINPVSQAAGD